MHISKVVTALTTMVLVGLLIQFGERTVLAQLGGLGGRTLTTEPVTIKPGMTARLEVANTGDQSFVAWLFFRDSAGKVLIKKQVTIKRGATEGLEYSLTGPNNPLKGANNATATHVEVCAEVGAKEIASIGLLQPALRIVENGNTILEIGQERFRETNPNGPHIEDQDKTELRPGNDPRKAPTKGLAEQDLRVGFSTTPFANNQIGFMRLTLTSPTPGPYFVRLQFVDDDGKVLAHQDAKVSKGNDVSLIYTPKSGVNAAGVKAQFAGNDKQSLLLLRPALEIVDSMTKSAKTVGSEGFTQIWGDPPAGRPVSNKN